MHLVGNLVQAGKKVNLQKLAIPAFGAVVLSVD